MSSGVMCLCMSGADTFDSRARKEHWILAEERVVS